MAEYEGRWDCPHCQSIGVLGRHKFCPNCGGNRAGVRFYLPQGTTALTDESQIRVAKAGPDWQCLHCQSDNFSTSQFCTQCGAGKGTSPSRKVTTYREAEVPRSGNDAPSYLSEPVSYYGSGEEDSRDEEEPAPYRSAPSYVSLGEERQPTILDRLRNIDSDQRNRIFTIGGISLLVIILLAFCTAMFRTTEVQVTVDHFEWSRTIYTEEYQTVREGDWSIPARGRYVSEEQKVHHTDRVLTHYETRTRSVPSGTEQYVCGKTDNGNGYFSDSYCTRTTYTTETYQEAMYRNDPVYATWYTYDIDKWVSDRLFDTSGNSREDPRPHWAQISFNCEREARLGCERESGRTARYHVFFRDEKGKIYTISVNEADWYAYEFNTSYTLEVNALGMIVSDPIRPKQE